MSTRANIAIKENGKYRYIFNGSDSYIDGLGITLFQHYKDANKVRALINLGNTGSIYPNLENTAASYSEHMSRSRKERGTVAGYREGRIWNDGEYHHFEPCWEDYAPVETKNVYEVLDQEFTYIFDVSKNKWYVAYKYKDNKLRELETVLHSKKLLEELFSEMYNKEYLPEFYEKCMNA